MRDISAADWNWSENQSHCCTEVNEYELVVIEMSIYFVSLHCNVRRRVVITGMNLELVSALYICVTENEREGTGIDE